jgi:hypothetical protein
MALNQPFTALFVKLSAPEEISFMFYFILKSAGCKIIRGLSAQRRLNL